MFLEQAFAHWLGTQERRASTARRYRDSIVRVRRLGFESVEDVTVERVVSVQRQLLEKGWQVVSVRTEFAALRSVLKSLVPVGKFDRGTLAHLREVALEKPDPGRRRRMRFLTRNEFERLALVARSVVPRIELPLRVAVWSGLRPGELARIRGEDVRGGFFCVENLPEWGEAGSCKTGVREVPICQELAQVFSALPCSGWLFPSRDDRFRRGREPRTPFLSRWTLEQSFARARVAAGFGREVKLMTLRHTRASWWLQGDPAHGVRGASIYKVADWLGHSVVTCERSYGALVGGYDAECEAAPAA